MFDMDKLKENLRKIQEKIDFLNKEDINRVVQKLQFLNNSNEEDTRNYVIIPFFQSLGWDFTDPFSVKAEDADDTGKRPDYGFYVNRQKILNQNYR
jgi:predicted type IV restriction endonuclease